MGKKVMVIRSRGGTSYAVVDGDKGFAVWTGVVREFRSRTGTTYYVSIPKEIALELGLEKGGRVRVYVSKVDVDALVAEIQKRIREIIEEVLRGGIQEGAREVVRK